jgi:hypothetical protein
MAENEFHVNDIGSRLLITVVDEEGTAVDLSSFTSGSGSMTVWIVPKGQSLLEVTPQLLTDGSDGKMYYDIVAGMLSVKGIYRVQVFLVNSSGQWHTSIVEFTVSENLKI